RYGAELAPAHSAAIDTLAAAVAPTLRRYLTGDLDAPCPGPRTGSGPGNSGIQPSGSNTSESKHVRVPVWQAGPVWSTRSNTVSASQSSRTSRTCCVWPDVAPLTHSCCLLREK